jgi:hypothetical protein
MKSHRSRWGRAIAAAALLGASAPAIAYAQVPPLTDEEIESAAAAIDQVVVAALRNPVPRTGEDPIGSFCAQPDCSDLALSSDAEFLRRATADIAGRTPTTGELDRFLNDRRGDKRLRLVERLVYARRAGPDADARVNDAETHWGMQIVEQLGARRDRGAGPCADASDRLVDALALRLKDGAGMDQIAMDLVVGRHGYQAGGDSLLGTLYDCTFDDPEDGHLVLDKVDALMAGLMDHKTACARCHEHRLASRLTGGGAFSLPHRYEVLPRDPEDANPVRRRYWVVSEGTYTSPPGVYYESFPEWTQWQAWAAHAAFAESAEHVRVMNSTGTTQLGCARPAFWGDHDDTRADFDAVRPPTVPEDGCLDGSGQDRYTEIANIRARRNAFAGKVAESRSLPRAISHRIWAELTRDLFPPGEIYAKYFWSADRQRVRIPLLTGALVAAFESAGQRPLEMARIVAATRTYQLSSRVIDADPVRRTLRDQHYGRHMLRRNRAETLMRGLWIASGRLQPENTAAAYATAYARDFYTGVMELGAVEESFASYLGLPLTRAAANERNVDLGVPQWLVTANSTGGIDAALDLGDPLDGNKNAILKLFEQGGSPEQTATRVVEYVFRALLGRRPSALELADFRAQLLQDGDLYDRALDLFWAAHTTIEALVR